MRTFLGPGLALLLLSTGCGEGTARAPVAPADPATGDPVTTRPAATDPATTDPATTDPATTDPAPDDPAIEDPAIEDPAIEDPATGDPATEAAAMAGPRLPDDETHEQRFAESRFFVERDMFIAADRPPTVGAGVADFLTPTDEVLGFVQGDQAWAYDVRMLSYHHVVNDQIGDQPIAVTY